MSYGYKEEDSDEDSNPLNVWMDDDSLAPPCGCEIDFIPHMLEMGKVKEVSSLLKIVAEARCRRMPSTQQWGDTCDGVPVSGFL
ncbi:hypothetical protein TrVE_jg9274 [Triparma verrucosa]|uniref:Uncharacterized protein n=1 Tax=Triparma verrucosa TaxID=1606542 RepID=A0A9W7EV96_9STRA|nr:hypothetical protein TrVE_jg9274 [Triparma verrucosa]